MRPHRLTASRALLLALALAVTSRATAARAEDFRIEPLKDAPPATLAAPVRESLHAEGFRVLDDKGKVYAELWLRKVTPASEKPGGPKGTVQFPFLGEGELLGALRFPGEGRDNRDQSITKGVYTLRYGLQPVNGDHLGVSPYRDYALLLPAAKDTALAAVARKPLEERSSESAGTSHPAIWLLSTPPVSVTSAPAMAHDEEKNTWGAVVPLSLEVKGASGVTSLNIQLIVNGVLGG